MNKNLHIATVALAAATLSFSTAFGRTRTNDFEFEVQQAENSSDSYNLSIEFFYAASLDDYFDDAKINLFGGTFSITNAMPLNDKVALELGVLCTLDYGTDSVSGYVDLTQADFMVGPQFGLRFNPRENISFGIGAQFGVDVRYGEIEAEARRYNYSVDDTGFGTFLGLYAGPKIKLSESCDLSFTARYVKTSVEFDFYGIDEDVDIDYLMFGVGVNFKF